MLHPEIAVIVMTAFATVNSAVEAMRMGATDYLTKPFALNELAAVLQAATERRTVDLASRQLRDKLRTQQGLGNIIGSSGEMEKFIASSPRLRRPAIRSSFWGKAGRERSW